MQNPSKVYCVLCQSCITQDDDNIVWDAKYLYPHGWLCYYCARGVEIHKSEPMGVDTREEKRGER